MVRHKKDFKGNNKFKNPAKARGPPRPRRASDADENDGDNPRPAKPEFKAACWDVFSTELVSRRVDVTRFSTPRMTPSPVAT